MGNLTSSLLACGFGDDDDHNGGWPLTNGYPSSDAEERLRHEREQRICDEIQKRETKLADLEADARDLEREAVRHKQSAQQHTRGSRQYQLSLGNARRSLVAVQKKRALMAKERKLVDIANAAVERMRVVDEGGDDSRFISDLREFTEAVDIADHTIAADQTRSDATQVLDNAASLLNLQERMVDGYADLEDPDSMGAGATMLFGDETLSLNDDNDLMRALSQLESDQEPRTRERASTNYAPMPNARAASRNSSSSSSATQPRSRLSEVGTGASPAATTMLPAPRGQPMVPSVARKRALAYETNGSAHVANSNNAADDDPFANLF